MARRVFESIVGEEECRGREMCVRREGKGGQRAAESNLTPNLPRGWDGAQEAQRIHREANAWIDEEVGGTKAQSAAKVERVAGAA
jgi:hypothetical protein